MMPMSISASNQQSNESSATQTAGGGFNVSHNIGTDAISASNSGISPTMLIIGGIVLAVIALVLTLRRN